MSNCLFKLHVIQISPQRVLLFVIQSYSICPTQHTAHEQFKRKPTSLTINFTMPVHKPACTNDGYFLARVFLIVWHYKK